MGVEVQRSHLTVSAAKARTTKALQAGVTPVWFTDTARNPPWLGHVPGVRLNPKIPWDRVPRPRTVSVAGVRRIVERNCRTWAGSPCPRHSRGCSRWHPDHVPQLGVFADDLAELVPVGELVPMRFRTFDGRKQVLIVPAEGKDRYEAMVGQAADLPVKAAARRGMPAGQEGLIECATPRAGALRPGHARVDVDGPDPALSVAPAQQQATADLLPLTPAQQQMASELPWYRQWLLKTGRSEDDLIPFFT
jgi:hypothetical protein